jgi:uncharacterized protein
MGIAAGLPSEKAGTFLLVRRGIPLALVVASLVSAMLDSHGRGWYLLLAMACIAEVWPTFKRGDDYLRTRAATLRWDSVWVKAFRPLARLLGKEDAWILSFCAWNNRQIRPSFEARRARKALLLLPHCIQASSCKAEIVQDLGHCYSCGRCPAGDVLAHSLAHKWNVRLSNRSHKAYREAREFKPDLIVAVSCADRLLKGLIKLPEVPCYVIPLQLPHGMCVDTTFHVPHLQAAMEYLVEPKAQLETKVERLRVRKGA